MVLLRKWDRFEGMEQVSRAVGDTIPCIRGCQFMAAENQTCTLACAVASEAEPEPQENSNIRTCAEEHRCWIELIQWLKKLGFAEGTFQENMESFLQATEEIRQKTAFFIMQRENLALFEGQKEELRTATDK